MGNHKITRTKEWCQLPPEPISFWLPSLITCKMVREFFSLYLGMSITEELDVGRMPPVDGITHPEWEAGKRRVWLKKRIHPFCFFSTRTIDRSIDIKRHNNQAPNLTFRALATVTSPFERLVFSSLPNEPSADFEEKWLHFSRVRLVRDLLFTTLQIGRGMAGRVRRSVNFRCIYLLTIIAGTYRRRCHTSTADYRTRGIKPLSYQVYFYSWISEINVLNA